MSPNINVYNVDGEIVGNMTTNYVDPYTSAQADSASNCVPAVTYTNDEDGNIVSASPYWSNWHTTTTSAPYVNILPTSTSSWTTSYTPTVYDIQEIIELKEQVQDLIAQIKHLKTLIPTDKKTYRVSVYHSDDGKIAKPYRIVYVQAKSESSAVLVAQNTIEGINPADRFIAEEW